MELKLSARKKKDPVVDTLTLPVATAFRERYERLKNELHRRDYETLHSMTRECITSLLDKLEKDLQDLPDAG